MRDRLWAFVSVILLACATARADEPNAPPDTAEKQGPLASLPSEPDAAHLKKLAALGDGEWLNLGSPAPDPKWGKARGRAWSPKAAFAPELRGAFVAGQGVHAFVKPDGHYQDDIFFYDINRHRWICAYPGADVKNLTLTVNEDGFEVDEAGDPRALAWCGHMYQDITYNPDAKRLMFMDNPDPYYRGHFGRRDKWREGKKLAHRGTPWFWNTQTGKFERRVCTGNPPPHHYGRVLVYLGQGKTFHWWGGAWKGVVGIHDYKPDHWARMHPSGDAPPWDAYMMASYDSKRKHVYIGGRPYKESEVNDTLRIYDVAANKWTNPKPKNAVLTYFPNNVANMHYDSVNDVIIVFARSERTHRKTEHLGVHVYDPTANQWRKPLPLPDSVRESAGNLCWTGFYDPQTNMHFFHTAGDSRDNGTMWAFRYKRADKEQPDPGNPE